MLEFLVLHSVFEESALHWESRNWESVRRSPLLDPFELGKFPKSAGIAHASHVTQPRDAAPDHHIVNGPHGIQCNCATDHPAGGRVELHQVDAGDQENHVPKHHDGNAHDGQEQGNTTISAGHAYLLLLERVKKNQEAREGGGGGRCPLSFWLRVSFIKDS